MPLHQLLAANRVNCKAQCTSKKRALETLAELIANSVPSLDGEQLFQHLINRERLGSTGIGQGIAIPHCRFATAGASICAVMTLEQAIDFDAADNQPVDILFAMLVPEDADNAPAKFGCLSRRAFQQPGYAQSRGGYR